MKNYLTVQLPQIFKLRTHYISANSVLSIRSELAEKTISPLKKLTTTSFEINFNLFYRNDTTEAIYGQEAKKELKEGDKRPIQMINIKFLRCS